MERILQHRKPSDVQFGVKDYLKDEWSRIPVNQKCSKAKSEAWIRLMAR